MTATTTSSSIRLARPEDFEAWLALRGLKTLPLRMRQQCENALAVAQWLVGRAGVARVNFPGLLWHRLPLRSSCRQ